LTTAVGDQLRPVDTVNVSGAPGGSLRSSLPPPPDQVDEDDYRKQLRKMQRSMSPGSLQQQPEHRVSIR